MWWYLPFSPTNKLTVCFTFSWFCFRTSNDSPFWIICWNVNKQQDFFFSSPQLAASFTSYHFVITYSNQTSNKAWVSSRRYFENLPTLAVARWCGSKILLQVNKRASELATPHWDSRSHPHLRWLADTVLWESHQRQVSNKGEMMRRLLPQHCYTWQLTLSPK